ncbi:MAG: hypothetical protein ABEH77_02005 [Halobacteriaceae archaeon]
MSGDTGADGDAGAGTDSDEPRSDDPAGDSRQSDTGEGDTDGSGLLPADTAEIRRYLWWGGLVGASAFAAVAAVNVYLSVGTAIDIWVSRRYEPVFQAAFNLAVLLVAAAGLSALVRRRV